MQKISTWVFLSFSLSFAIFFSFYENNWLHTGQGYVKNTFPTFTIIFEFSHDSCLTLTLNADAKGSVYCSRKSYNYILCVQAWLPKCLHSPSCCESHWSRPSAHTSTMVYHTLPGSKTQWHIYLRKYFTHPLRSPKLIDVDSCITKHAQFQDFHITHNTLNIYPSQ